MTLDGTEPQRRGRPRWFGWLLAAACGIALAVCAGAFLSPFYTHAKWERVKKDHARTKARQLGDAIQAYQVRHGEPPKALEDLLAGDRPLVEPTMLLDPWGRPYQYDPAGPHHGGAMPDVWSLGPVYAEGDVIGNWP